MRTFSRASRWRRRYPLVVAVTVILNGTLVRAQHAADNPVASADDAFGLTLGLESIGMYSSGQVRGFSPLAAGNVRIDGLFFDQQGALSKRVIEGSTIRVGLSEIGYAFPAPTGIVDYDLRHTGDGTPSATIVATAGPYQARGLSLDGNLPLNGKELQLPIGVSRQVSTQTPYGAYAGYTSTVTNAGATPQWSPTEDVKVRAFFDWQQTHAAKTFPLFFTSGNYFPPPVSTGYLGQNWAESSSQAENYGLLSTVRLSSQWKFAAGVFHSSAVNPVAFTDLYLDTQPNGRAEHVLVGSPDQRATSTSGELHLTGRFLAGSWRHELTFLARGRDTHALYGGDDSVDVGQTYVGARSQVPEPNFVYSARVHDRSELWSIGAAYRAKLPGLVDLEIGVQDQNYRKDVSSPGAPEASSSDRPPRVYGNAAVTLGRRVTLYAGYTQGLEDSGVAPSAAENRGAILPAARTWQFDAGLRYLLTPKLKLIAGIYEIQKPYFNLDTGAIDRDLGVQRARGVELSISGQPIDHLDLTAGVLAGSVRIAGPNLVAEGVGPIAFGQPRVQYVTDANYTVPWWPVLSLDLAVLHYGSQPASVNNALYSPANTQLNLGGRYRFTVFGKSSALRVEIQNAPNSHWWTTAYTAGFFQWPGPRTVFGYLTTDL